MHVEVGQVLLRKYLVDRLVGQGATGSVYEARDYAQDRTVAIRLIEIEDAHVRTTVFNENDAKRAGQLGSVHLAELLDIDALTDGTPFVVGEFVRGETLRARMQRLGCTSELGAIQLLVQLLRGLAAAHSAGAVHRDLTPRSVFIASSEDGNGDVIKLIDFGLSRIDLVQANPQALGAIPIDIDSFQYLSPEQLSGLRDLDPRSNVYSLGVIAYEAITGRLPFEGNSISALALNILQLDPTPVEMLAPKTSPQLARLIRKAMARTPNARFRTAEEMFAAVTEIAEAAGIVLSALEIPAASGPGRASVVPASNAAAAPAPAPMEQLPAYDLPGSEGRESPVAADSPYDSRAAASAEDPFIEESDEQTPPRGTPLGVTPETSAPAAREGSAAEPHPDPNSPPNAPEAPAGTGLGLRSAEEPMAQSARVKGGAVLRAAPSAPQGDPTAGQPARLTRRVPSVRPTGAAQTGATSARPTAASVRPGAAPRPAAERGAAKSTGRPVAPATDSGEVSIAGDRPAPQSRKLFIGLIGLMGLVIVALAIALLTTGGDRTESASPETTPSAQVAAVPVSSTQPTTVAAAPTPTSVPSVASSAAGEPEPSAVPATPPPSTTSAARPTSSRTAQSKASGASRTPQRSTKSSTASSSKKSGTQKRAASKDPYNYR